MSKHGKETREFSEKIKRASLNKVVETVLKTSERVLRRITDGIYRQPSSALRELISNAYDADATQVEIQMDPPRFNSIIIRDNGNGLTEEALSHLIHNIGGSPKRTAGGVDLHICNSKDKSLSPGGRKLIGKIGIGLFSVSQLTKEFEIITKIKGANHRTIMDVNLFTETEDNLDDLSGEFQTGTVKIWKVPATDTASHGTEIILRNLLQKTKNDLSSKELWSLCNPENLPQLEGVDFKSQPPPSYHIGCIHDDSPDEIGQEPCLPWKNEDKPEKRFQKLVQAMFDEQRQTVKNLSLVDSLDYYLQMLWTLSLSAPLNYIGKHPFDLEKEPGIRIFEFANEFGSQAKELKLKPGCSIRDALNLASPERGKNESFTVIIDGVQLFRPLKFHDLPKTGETIPYPLLFVGKANPDLSSIPAEIRGGELKFEAYFLWNHTIVPKEHTGVLVRVNDSSGILFDETLHQALLNLCDYQINHRREPWLLFLTTLADRKSVHQSDLPYYWQNIISNAGSMEAFRDKLEGVIGTMFSPKGKPEIDDTFLQKLSVGGFAKLFGIGVGKWLLNILTVSSSSWRVEMLASSWYRVQVSNKSEPNMLSLAFKFAPFPEPLRDPSGLVPKSTPVNPPGEQSLALGLLDKVSSLLDLDKQLCQDRAVMQRCIDETSKLLEAARYPVANKRYEDWARKETLIFCD